MPQLISLFDVHSIATELASQSLWLTPNQRLASRISSAYAIYCKQHGHAVVAAPNIASYNQWLDARWRELILLAHPPAIEQQLLSLDEQSLIIERLIINSDEGQMLLRPSATAQQVASAIDTLEQWCVDLTDEETASQFYHDDSRCFLKWARAYYEYCAEHNLLPPAKKATIVLAAYQNQVLQSAPTMTLTAFETITPQQKLLLGAACIELKQQDINYKSCINKTAVSCDSAEHEILVAALWAKQQFKDAVDADNLPAIAVVVPQLNQNKAMVRRIFEEVFIPESQKPQVARRGLPFNISAGNKLAEEPVVMAAINLLELAFSEVDCDELIALLQNPYAGFSSSEPSLINQLIILIKRQKLHVIKLSLLRRLVERVAKTNNNDEDNDWCLLKLLLDHASMNKRAGIHSQKTAEHWHAYIIDVLELFAWPGHRNPDSHEYQAIQQFQQVLSKFAQLNVLGLCDFANALVYLKQLLANSVYQPQSKESPLQILGLLEASGLHFDHIWLTGMSAKQWPAAPKPNPLIPFDMQQHHQMPNSTADKELQLAEHFIQRFIASTRHFYVSYAKIIDDNPCTMSALFKGIEEVPPEAILQRSIDSLNPQQEILRRHQESRITEDFDYADAPKLNDKELIKGGTSLFANQSACPFKAFATHRLSLKGFEQAVVGLDRSVKGNLLHRALELIWKQLVDSATLIALTEFEQNKICTDYSDFVLNEYSHKLAEPLGLRHHKIESKRLAQLLSAWLNVEKERASFTVVAREEKKTFRYAQLELVGRIDRVDQLSDGSQLVVDYKTGKPNINAWWGDRPEQPQLPLYTELLTQEGKQVSAIAFAQVNIESRQLKGVGEQDHSETRLAWSPKIQSQSSMSSWSNLKEHWRTVLTSLANDFIAGESKVDPANAIKSCQYCDLSSVCRINHINTGTVGGAN